MRSWVFLWAASLVGCSSSASVLLDCMSSMECRGGELCRDGQCREACTADDPCSGPLGACDPARGYCVECVLDTDCGAGSLCDTTEGRCIMADCAVDADCRGGERCDAGLCVPIGSGCTTSQDCAGGERCDAGECVPIDVSSSCEDSSDCAGGERCDAGECVPIVTGCAGDGDCAEGQTCDAGTCVAAPECARDSECAGGERCSMGSCVPIGSECGTAAECAAGEICDAGSCIAAPMPECTRTDECMSGERCSAGSCVPVATMTDCGKLDILFVVDDSPSMPEEQMNLALHGGTIVEELDLRGIDWRIGVTTTGKNLMTSITFMGLPTMTTSEMGPEGALLRPASCGMSRDWIAAGDASAATSLSCLVNVGTAGSSYEMPLLMSQWAVTERVTDGQNAGFLRSDAMLAVLVITDENDCSRPESTVSQVIDPFSPTGSDVCAEASLVPIPGIISSFDRVKGGRDGWAMYFIAAPSTCTGPFGDGTAATRLNDFVAATPTNAALESICVSDLGIPLTRAVDHFESVCGR